MKDVDEKIMATVRLLRQHVKWNGKYNLYGSPASQVLKNGRGSNTDINFMLIAMLNDAGINSYPAVLCARDIDIIDENRSTMKNFTSTIVVIDRGDRFQVFDGSMENATIDILPTKFLVSKARVIKKDNNNPWINLEDKGLELISHKFTGDIDQNGKLTATCVSTYHDKAAEQMRTEIKKQGEELFTTNSNLHKLLLATTKHRVSMTLRCQSLRLSISAVSLTTTMVPSHCRNLLFHLSMRNCSKTTRATIPSSSQLKLERLSTLHSLFLKVGRLPMCLHPFRWTPATTQS